MIKPQSYKYQVHVWILLAAAIFLFFFRLGDRSFRNPDEGRYATIAREMVETNHWVEPKLYGIDYLSKPVLFYWLIALSFKIFGFSEWAARLVPVCFGIAGILTTFWFCRKVFDEPTAFWAGLILATNLWYLEVGRYLVIDAVFSFFLTAAFYCFYLGCCQAEVTRRYLVGFYASLALAVLAKGLAGIAIPGFCLFLFLSMTGQFKKFFGRIHLVEGVLIFSVITFPWFVMISLRKPGFLSSFFLHEHLQRFVSTRYEHQEPWYYYLWVLPALLLPWFLFFRPWSLKRRPVELYLSIILAGIVIFYSLAHSKLATYMLPTLPIFAMMLSRSWREWEVSASSRPSAKIPLFFWGALALFSLSVLVVPAIGQAAFKKLTPDLISYFRVAVASLFLMSGCSLFFLIKRKIGPLFYSMVIFSAVFSLLAAFVMEVQNQNYSTKLFAEALKIRAYSEEAIFIYDDPGAFYDFKFYLGRPVKLVGLEGELKKQKGDKEVSLNTVSRNDFFATLEGSQKIICLIRKSDYQELAEGVKSRLKILREDKRKVLLESVPTQRPLS